MSRLKLVKDNTNFNFMRIHKLAMGLSALMMILSVVLLFTKGLNLGIDFTGGLLMEVKTPATVHISEIRDTLEKLSTGTPTIQEFGDNSVMIKIPGKEADQATQKKLYEEVKKLLGTEVEYRRVEYVGPQVGQELIMMGFKAFIYSMIGILGYLWIRFEWQFGVTGVMALAHDVCATCCSLPLPNLNSIYRPSRRYCWWRAIPLTIPWWCSTVSAKPCANIKRCPSPNC
jgi:preprotein translocase subunit SecF